MDLKQRTSDGLLAKWREIREIHLGSVFQLEDPVGKRGRAHLTDSPNDPCFATRDESRSMSWGTAVTVCGSPIEEVNVESADPWIAP